MEFWGDGSGGVQALTEAYVNANAISITTETYLYCQLTLSGTTAVAVDLRLQLSFDAGQTWRTYDLLPLTAVEGSVTQHNFALRVMPHCNARLGLRRRGGGALSAAFVEAYLREHSGDLDETRPQTINYAVALDATADTPVGAAGDPLPLNVATEYGDWFDVGIGDRLEIILLKTGVGNPTEVFLEIQQQEGAVGHPLDAIDAVAAGEVTHSAMEILATDIDATNPLYRLYRVDVEPNTTIRIGGRYNGGTSADVLVYGRIVRR